MQFNLFHLTVPLVGVALFFLLRSNQEVEVSFFGFAESNETEINYNYPVVVDEISVTPGQAVEAGDVLIKISRIKAKETLEDQNFRIAELQAEEAIWRQKQQNELAELELNKATRLSEVATKIAQVEKELAFKKSLADGLSSITTPSETAYKPLEEKLEELQSDKNHIEQTISLKIDGIQKELRVGNTPYRERVRRLNAEKVFDDSQKVQRITVTAPADGLIGNISCKAEEHIPSYRTLLSFYEPHSGIIKGYVHENLTLKVQIGDLFEIASLKDASIKYEGKVIGLGSRIVEIPTRLRKMPDLKTYGREVLVEITKDNSFLQKEKVSLRYKEI